MINRITIEDNEKFLRQISSDIDFLQDDYKKYLNNLKRFCMESEVYALAPVQIGFPKRIIYIRNTNSDMRNNNDNSYDEEIIYINPVIKKMYGLTQFLEGCASCKYSDGNYVTGVVDRPYKIEIDYYNVNGEKCSKDIEGFECTIFCHEYDHLNGILHMDRIDNSYLMTYEQMRGFRENNPYKIISKSCEFRYKK